jgi:hypothetical protein
MEQRLPTTIETKTLAVCEKMRTATLNHQAAFEDLLESGRIAPDAANVLLDRTEELRSEFTSSILQLKRSAGVRGMRDDTLWSRVFYELLFGAQHTDEQLFKRGRLSPEAQDKYISCCQAFGRLQRRIYRTLRPILSSNTTVPVTPKMRRRANRGRNPPLAKLSKKFPRTAEQLERVIRAARR